MRLAALSFRYGPVTVPFGDLRAKPTRLAKGRLYVVERDVAAEQRAVARLLAHGLSPAEERRVDLPKTHAGTSCPMAARRPGRRSSPRPCPP